MFKGKLLYFASRSRTRYSFGFLPPDVRFKAVAVPRRKRAVCFWAMPPGAAFGPNDPMANPHEGPSPRSNLPGSGGAEPPPHIRRQSRMRVAPPLFCQRKTKLEATDLHFEAKTHSLSINIGPHYSDGRF